jgi:hypothetical protein
MSVEAHELISRYRETVRAGTRARWAMMTSLLAVIALNGLLVKGSFDDFRAHGWPEFSETLGQELAYVEPELSGHAAGMFERLLPVYAFELEASLSRHKPALIEQAREEMAALESYANGRWPEIQTSLTDMVVEQESLASVMTDKQAEEVSHRYARHDQPTQPHDGHTA